MAYRAVPTQVRKDGTRGWRILWRAKFEGTKEKARHVRESEYSALGIRAAMTCEEANARLKQINIDEDRKKHEARRNSIKERLAKEDSLECEHLPEVFANKFEKEHLSAKYLDNPDQLKKVAIYCILKAVSFGSDWHRD